MSAPSTKAAAPKLCKGCRFARRARLFAITTLGLGTNQWLFAKCMHPSAALATSKTNHLVSGRVSPDYQHYCSTHRASQCGEQGRFWAAR